MSFLYFFDLLGTIVFAISGVILAGKMRMDPFGVFVLATTTAIGGGTVRDAILGATPVFWVIDPTYLYVIIATCIIFMMFVKLISPLNEAVKINKFILPVLDAIGLAVFVGIGVNKALIYGSGALVAIVMGIITGVGGGILRDVLAREIPMILQKEVYATACLAGASIHIVFYNLGFGTNASMLMGMFVTLLIRLTAIAYNLKLPTFTIK
ncbi:inner membrane protein [Gammaproteobacteria bacterium]|nr:inner membrane protein [Gammaproteobacteria bacterium]